MQRIPVGEAYAIIHSILAESWLQPMDDSRLLPRFDESVQAGHIGYGQGGVAWSFTGPVARFHAAVQTDV